MASLPGGLVEIPVEYSIHYNPTLGDSTTGIASIADYESLRCPIIHVAVNQAACKLKLNASFFAVPYSSIPYRTNSLHCVYMNLGSRGTESYSSRSFVDNSQNRNFKTNASAWGEISKLLEGLLGIGELFFGNYPTIEALMHTNLANLMKQRHLVPEKMDDPGLCPKEHYRALAGLRRINRLSGTANQLQREVLRIASRSLDRQWRILDVGCADGEIAFELSGLLADRMKFVLTGWDMSEVAIAAAHKRIEHRTHRAEASLCFEVRNLFDELEAIRGDPPFDIVYCTLLLHHFSDQDAVRILAAMRRLARHAVIVDDLQRTNLGWWLALIGCRVLSRSPVVHFDGPQSVRAAFSCSEVLALAGSAGLSDAKLRRHWPERFMLCWEGAT